MGADNAAPLAGTIAGMTQSRTIYTAVRAEWGVFSGLRSRTISFDLERRAIGDHHAKTHDEFCHVQ